MRLRKYGENESNLSLQLLPWPPESPDCMPIESVFGDLKTWLRNEFCPQNLEQVREGVKFWTENYLTKEKCRMHIGHVRGCMEKVVQKNGWPLRGRDDVENQD